MTTRTLAAKPRWGTSIDSILRRAADRTGATPPQICSRSRHDAAVFGRWVAVHDALATGMTGAEVARALRITQQAVSVIRRRPMPASLLERTRGFMTSFPANDGELAIGASCV